jgi:hypothetical protein
MARTTAAKVQAIIQTKASISLDPFIETANHLVTKVCTSSNYDATDLELIERWLAAHFYAVRDPRRLREKAGPVSAEYKGKWDLKLNLTEYGQQVLLLDYEGHFAALNERKNAAVFGLTYLGAEEGELPAS